MKLSEFNELPIEEKDKYIKSFVQAKPSIASALVFENYSILMVSTIYGELKSATAEVHNNRQRQDARKLLKGKPAVALDVSHLPAIKRTADYMLFNRTNRAN